MSGPACTTTYHVPLAGGYLRFISVVLTSESPWPSATTWFKANAMPPRDWHVPRWMCETWDEFACRPLTFSSMAVVLWSANSVIVPLAVTPGSGVRRNVTPFGLGEDVGLDEAGGVGEAVVADSPPQAIAQTATATTANHALGITAAGYWSGPEFLPGPLPIRVRPRYGRQGSGTRRHRSTR